MCIRDRSTFWALRLEILAKKNCFLGCVMLLRLIDLKNFRDSTFHNFGRTCDSSFMKIGRRFIPSMMRVLLFSETRRSCTSIPSLMNRLTWKFHRIHFSYNTNTTLKILHELSQKKIHVPEMRPIHCDRYGPIEKPYVRGLSRSKRVAEI